MFVADVAIVDPVLCTLLDVAVALDVVAIVDAPTTSNTNDAAPDNVLDAVALAFLSRPADAVVPDAVITIDPLSLARIAEEAVADTETTAPAPSVTNHLAQNYMSRMYFVQIHYDIQPSINLT